MRWIIALLVVSLLAGCTADKSDTPDEPLTGQPTDPSSEDPNSPGTPTVEPTSPEQVSVVLGVDKTTGIAPLDVTLTVDASHAAAWTLYDNADVVQEGASAPKQLQLTLDEGTHVLKFKLLTSPAVEDTITIVVQPAPIPAQRHLFTGAFEAAAEDALTHDFGVPTQASGISVILTWAEDFEDELDVAVAPPTWNLDVTLVAPDGTTHAIAADSFEAATIDAVTPGAWLAQVNPGQVKIPLEYELEIVVWGTTYTTAIFEGTMQGANLGWPTPEATQTAADLHDIPMPDGTAAVAMFLTWTAPESEPCAGASLLVDFDLVGYQGGEERLSSTHGRACEAASWGGDAAGDWQFEVLPFLVPESSYVLTVLYG